MAVFTLSNGKTFEVEGATGKYLEVLVREEYVDKKGFEGTYRYDALSDYEGADQQVERIVSMRNRETLEGFKMKQTFLLAENKEYKEYGQVTGYSSGASNTSEVFLVEVQLQDSEISKRLLIPFKSRGYAFYDIVEDIVDIITERVEEGELEDQGARYDEEIEEDFENGPYVMMVERTVGDYMEVELSKRGIKDMISSIRLVEFEMHIDRGNE